MRHNKIKKYQNKGFTMVELLATIVILGLMTSITIVGVQKILDNAKIKYYESSIKELKLAAQSYVQDNRSMLPKQIGRKTTISLKTLVDKKYIDKIIDYKKEDCSLNESHVTVFKYDKSNYSYTPYLICPDYGKNEDSNTLFPKINISFEGKTGDLKENNNVKTASTSITIKGLESDSKVTLMGYEYKIYSNDKEVFSSGSVNANNKNQITINKDLTEWTPSKLVVKVTAINIYGIDKTEQSQFTYDDKKDPICGTIKEVVNGTSKAPDNSWITIPNSERTFTVECSDGTGSGCTRDVFKKTFKTQMKTGYIEVQDNAGNTTKCPVPVRMDWTAPTLKVTPYKRTSAGDKGDVAGNTITANNTNKNVTLNSYTDLVNNWMNKAKYENGVYYKLEIIDGVALYTKTWETNPKEILSNNEKYNTLTKSEDSSVTYTTTSGEKGKQTSSQYLSGEGERKARLVVKDEAGNTVTVNIEANIDRTAPEKPTVTNENNNKWKKESYTVKLDSTDLISKINKYKYKYDSLSSWTDYDNSNSDSFTTPNFSKERNENVYFKACDFAGNCSASSDESKIKIDKTAPNCTSSGGSDSWTNSSRTLIGTCSDPKMAGNTSVSGSGCVKATSDGRIYDDSGSVSWLINWEGSWTNLSPGSVYDAAGNKTDCSNNQTVKIDKTAPKCTSSGGSNTNWHSNTITIYGNCTDTGGSGCVKAKYSKKFSLSEGTHKKLTYGTVYDNAGNSAACPENQIAKMDNTPPTCTSSGGSDSWTNSSRTLKGTCKDTGGSGCAKPANDTTHDSSGNVSWLINWDGSWTNLSPGTVYDAAGNSTVCPKNQTVKVDRTPPEIRDSAISGWNIEYMNYGGGKSYTISYADATSGIDHWEAYSVTGGGCNSGWKNAGGSLCDGSQMSAPYARAYKAVDNAGNVSKVYCTYMDASKNVYTSSPDGNGNCTVQGYSFSR